MAKLCPWARETCPAVNSATNEAKTTAPKTCLALNMNRWELTTFDSSKGANAARARTKQCRPRATDQDSRNQDSRKNDSREAILSESSCRMRQARILD